MTAYEPPEYASKGSQKWLQYLVNEQPGELNAALRTGASLQGTHVEWVSPLAKDGYAEYRDNEFLDRLGLTLPSRRLADFWPARGPVWDGLAKTDTDEVILVEAKSHIAEAVSPPSRASEESLAQIRKSLDETKTYLGGNPDADWAGLFYQVTNRLAHLYLLRILNNVRAHLVFLYFVGDREMGGPETVEEWRGAIRLMETALGLIRHKLSPITHHVFFDVRQFA